MYFLIYKVERYDLRGKYLAADALRVSQSYPSKNEKDPSPNHFEMQSRTGCAGCFQLRRQCVCAILKYRKMKRCLFHPSLKY